MIDVKREKIEVARLELGMFVADLDRPWEGTPFFLQGFVIEDQTEIDKLKSLCSFVYVDRTKSIGNQFSQHTVQPVAIKREGSVTIQKVPKQSVASKKVSLSGDKGSSFIDILRELRGKNTTPTQQATGNNQEGTMYNMRYSAESASHDALPYDTKPVDKNASFAQQLATDVGGFFGGLFKRDKTKSPAKNDSTLAANQESNTEASYKLTIYEEEEPVENEIAKIYPVYEQSQIATRAIFDSIANENQIDLTAVSEILDNMVDSIGRTPDALLWLAKLKQTDDYAYNHALNVSITSMAFGNFLAFSKKQIKEMGLAGLLQDVGKVKLSADILLKKDKLTREEYEYAKKHVDESLKILEKTPDIPAQVIQMVSQHHERVDGTGYPAKLSGTQIDLGAQIAGLVDTYCAITSTRNYAKGVYHQQALDQIHQLSGKQFSNELVDQLVQFMGMYPVSSLVELNTGEVGVVIQQNQVRRLLPRVMLLLDPTKRRYEAPVILNLLNSPNTPSGEPYRIVKSIAPDSYGLNPTDFYI